MNENERKVVVRRMLLLIAVACIIMGLYTFRLIFLQLVNGDDFKAKATNTTDYKFTVTAARGDIVDSTGKHIATTSTGYNVVLNKLQMGDQDLDTMLQQIVELLRKNDEKWLDTLLISEPDAAGNYTFTDSADSASDQKTLADMKETLGLQQYATANVRRRWRPSRSIPSRCRAWRSWRPAPAAMSRAISCPLCWGAWARSPPKSGR